MLLKISDFSQISQVTIKTLHHYDEIGLLKPAEIDKFTHYRYYTVEQLARIHRIIALKELGLSLDQIKLMLNDELTSEQLRGMFQLKRAEAQQRLQEEQARLTAIEFRLHMLEMEEEMPELEIIVKEIPPIHALTLRGAITREELVPFGAEIEAALAEYKVKPAGPVAEIRYAEEFKVDWDDVEYVLPVDETQTEDVPLKTFGTLEVKTVPGLKMAATYIHRGSDESALTEALPILQRWIVDNGHELCGTHRMVHHHGPAEHAEYEDWVTEIQHEIAVAE